MRVSNRRAVLGVVLFAVSAFARDPAGPDGFCATYPTSPMCTGTKPGCGLCHTNVPERNVYGAAISAQMAPGAPRPLSLGDFATVLPGALRAVEAADSDQDQVSNLIELQKGTSPSDPRSFPSDIACAGTQNPQFQVCRYDVRYVFKKVALDFCGRSPTFAELRDFDALASDDAKRARIDEVIDLCLALDFWRGKNGVLWKVAHPKIRPVGSLKEGEDRGQIPLADYYDDYALFTFAHTDDHDVREVLTANFYVARSGSNPTVYTRVETKSTQAVEVSKRAGNMTSAWNLVYFVMFTALPRNAASQMYRAYLGLDIAKQEGLSAVPNEPRDYDNKGVQATACAACHATLDPLSYPFRNYNGLTGNNRQQARYVPNRIETFFPASAQAPLITQIPESGVILGQPVANLTQWAQVAANSDAFASATVLDYWKLLVGHSPTSAEHAEFVQLWQALKTTHQYRVKPMLHQLVRTEAYGVP